jgi:hypothetical protein
MRVAKRLKNIVKWHIKSGLFHPLAVLLIAIIALGFYAILESYEDPSVRISMVSVVFEYTLFPLYAIFVALHLVRSHLVVVFEVNIFKSWEVLFVARLATFLLACAPLLATTLPVAYIAGERQLIVPILFKFATYASLLAPAILLGDRRASLLYLITAYMILPLSISIVLAGMAHSHGRIDALTSVLSYTLAPITMLQYKDLAEVPPLEAYAASTLILLVVVLASLGIFKRLEYGLEH